MLVKRNCFPWFIPQLRCEFKIWLFSLLWNRFKNLRDASIKLRDWVSVTGSQRHTNSLRNYWIYLFLVCLGKSINEDLVAKQRWVTSLLIKMVYLHYKATSRISNSYEIPPFLLRKSVLFDGENRYVCNDQYKLYFYLQHYAVYDRGLY